MTVTCIARIGMVF